MSSPSRTERWLPLILGAVLVLVMVWPWPLHPLNTLGAPDVEADNHLWMLWRTVQRVLGEPGPFMGWPEGEPRALVDLVHLPLALVGMSLHPSLGYGLLATVDVALAAAGGWWLAREAGASRTGSLVGLAALATAPALAGLLTHGLSEDWPVGLYALHAAALLRTARTQSWRDAVAAGGLLAAYALAGWYASLFAALASPALLLWAWRLHRPSRRAWGLILGSGAATVLLVLPAFAWLLTHQELDAAVARWLPEVWSFQPGWRDGVPSPAPPWGADPVNLVLPTLAHHAIPRTVYLGLVSLALAGVGAWRRTEARWPLVGAALLCGVALGDHLLVAGRPWVTAQPLPGPGAWLTALVPPLRAVAGWYRAVLPAMVFLSAAAALGADALARRRSLALVLAALVVADATLLSGVPWPRLSYDPRPPPELLAIPGHGPLLILPVDRGQTAWVPRVPRLYQRSAQTDNWINIPRRSVRSEQYPHSRRLNAVASPVTTIVRRNARTDAQFRKDEVKDPDPSRFLLFKCPNPLFFNACRSTASFEKRNPVAHLSGPASGAFAESVLPRTRPVARTGSQYCRLRASPARTGRSSRFRRITGTRRRSLARIAGCARSRKPVRLESAPSGATNRRVPGTIRSSRDSGIVRSGTRGGKARTHAASGCGHEWRLGFRQSRNPRPQRRKGLPLGTPAPVPGPQI